MPGAMPSGHARAVRENRRLTPRQRWTWGSGSAIVIIAAIVAILLTSSHKVGKGCVNVTVPSIYGSINVDQCGQAARATCAAGGVKGMYITKARTNDVFVMACRRAGYSVPNS